MGVCSWKGVPQLTASVAWFRPSMWVGLSAVMVAGAGEVHVDLVAGLAPRLGVRLQLAGEIHVGDEVQALHRDVVCALRQDGPDRSGVGVRGGGCDRGDVRRHVCIVGIVVVCWEVGGGAYVGREAAVFLFGPFGGGCSAPGAEVGVGVAAQHAAVLTEHDAQLLLGECPHLVSVELRHGPVIAVDLAVPVAQLSADVGFVLVAPGQMPSGERGGVDGDEQDLQRDVLGDGGLDPGVLEPPRSRRPSRKASSRRLCWWLNTLRPGV